MSCYPNTTKRGVALASAARTASTNSDVLNAPRGYKGIRFYIDATDSAATPSVTFSIQVKDNVGGDWNSVLTSAAITGAITTPTLLEIYPGLATAANRALGMHCGDKVRIASTAADADSLTYSVSYEWLY